MSETAVPPPKPRKLLRRAIAVIESRMERADPGELAQLRRLAVGAPGLAFWRIMAECRVDDSLRNAAREAIWPDVLSALAHLAPLTGEELPLGQALAETRYAEARLLRLLRADAASVGGEIGTVARWLAAKGVRAKGFDIADFALSRSRPDADSTDKPAHTIAKAYFDTIAHLEVKA